VFSGARRQSPYVGYEAGFAHVRRSGESAMVKLRRIAIVAAASAAASVAAFADDQKPAPAQPAYTPHLHDIMILTQLGHFKLCSAGKVQNGPLATYELDQIPASIKRPKPLSQNSSRSKMNTMVPAADALEKAIAKKAGAKFTTAFGKLPA